jgi:hypothetical protein
MRIEPPAMVETSLFFKAYTRVKRFSASIMEESLVYRTLRSVFTFSDDALRSVYRFLKPAVFWFRQSAVFRILSFELSRLCGPDQRGDS